MFVRRYYFYIGRTWFWTSLESDLPETVTLASWTWPRICQGEGEFLAAQQQREPDDFFVMQTPPELVGAPTRGGS
jgi:hypothetical protein